MNTHGHPILPFSALAALLTLAASPADGGQQWPKRIDAIAQAEAKYDLFSGTVLVAKDGTPLYAKAFGEANKEYDIPNVLESRFNISSVQKTFIATLIMQLFQEGKIALSDPLTKYFPECTYPTAKQIQVKHLLNHTSGLGDYRDQDEYQARSESYTCIEDVLPLLYRLEPAFAPGERFRYSNAGMLFLKAIIEKVEGARLKDVLERRILAPLGMYDTTMFRRGDLLSHRASAYALAEDGETYVRVLSEPSAYAGGGIYTTVLDLLKFDQAFYGEELLSKKNQKIMFTPLESSPDYAYGWSVTHVEGTQVIQHSGGSGGFNSEFRRYPEIGLTLIVLSNYQGAAFQLANKIEAVLLRLPYSLATESDLFFRRGMALQERGDYKKAIAFFQKNLDGARPHLPSLYQAARSRILGEFEQEKAIEQLDRYIELANEATRPSVAAAWWRKGVACEQLGRIEQAIVNHKKSLELDPDFEMAQEALAQIAGE